MLFYLLPLQDKNCSTAVTDCTSLDKVFPYAGSAIVRVDRPISNAHQVKYGSYSTDFDFCVNRFTGEVGLSFIRFTSLSLLT